MKYLLIVLALFVVGCNIPDIVPIKADIERTKASAGLATWLVSQDAVNPGPDNPTPNPSGICPDCNGDGFIGDGRIRITCDTCNGTGRVTTASAAPCNCANGGPCTCGDNCECEPADPVPMPEAEEPAEQINPELEPVAEPTVVSTRKICMTDGTCYNEVTYSDGRVVRTLDESGFSSGGGGWGTQSTSGRVYRTRLFPRLFR